MNTYKIIILDKLNPRKNLPYKSSSKRTENNFLLSFANTYLNSINMLSNNYDYLVARELPLNGYGIADLILIKAPSENNIRNTKNKDSSSIIAFEMKMNNWKRALSQAYKYKYFSNQSIVVLPNHKELLIIKNLETFKQLEVGIWTYDKKHKTINKIFTPKKNIPFNNESYEKAKALVISKVKFLQSA